MSEVFKVGDVVRLKSGGPRMTVTNPRAAVEPDMLTVIWHDISHLIRRGIIETECLCRAEEPSPEIVPGNVSTHVLKTG